MNERKRVLSNLIWRFLERFGAQGISLLVTIILARVLEPEVYGMVALVTVITTILQVFIDSGLGTALIQKKDADDIDFSTVFYFNMVVCVVLYGLLYLASPYIAFFYKMPRLVRVIRVLGLLLIISGFKNIQNAYVSKHLLFKKYFFATLGGTLMAAVIGIWMAYNGYGIWAIVIQNLVNQSIDTIILWVTVKWRPILAFSTKRLKELFSYGSKLLASSLIGTIWTQLNQLIIGKMYSSADLAFYNKGQEFPNYATTAINNSIDSVLFPVMSDAQDDIVKLKNITRRSIKISSFVLWPMMTGLAACAEPFISFVLTEKWLPAAPFLRIYCIIYAFQPIHTANLNAIKAIGRSDTFLGLEVAKRTTQLIILLITMRYGVLWIALGSLASSVISQIINTWPNKKYLGYSYIDQIKDISPSILLSFCMSCMVYGISYIKAKPGIILLTQIIVGIVFYVLGARVLKLEPFDYCVDVIKKIFGLGRDISI